MTPVEPLRIVPRRHPGRWVAAAVVVLLLALLVRAFARGAIRWDVVGQFLTAPAILAGLVNTCIMTVAAMALGLLLGVLFAVVDICENIAIEQAIAAGGPGTGLAAALTLTRWVLLALLALAVAVMLWAGRRRRGRATRAA